MEIYAKKVLNETLIEDIGYGDITTDILIPEKHESVGKIIFKEDGVLCGIHFVNLFLNDIGLRTNIYCNEGDPINKGTTIMEIYGNTKKILSVERTILNFLMHLSGISTKTYNIIQKVKKINKKVRISCTRKTLPVLAPLEKYAVYVANGDTHRFRLDDLVMIKDNHIAAVGLENIFKKIDRISFTKKIEVEVDNLNQLKEVIKYNPDIILLDNFKPEDVEVGVEFIRNWNKNILIEVSGGINESNVLDYARYNVDIISMGCLIHSARSLDISLDLQPMD